MKVPEHVALSYLIAQLGVQPQYGLTVLAGWRYYRKYHRTLGHGLPVTLLGASALAAVGSFVLALGPFWPLWGWLQVSLLAHLFVDV